MTLKRVEPHLLTPNTLVQVVGIYVPDINNTPRTDDDLPSIKFRNRTPVYYTPLNRISFVFSKLRRNGLKFVRVKERRSLIL